MDRESARSERFQINFFLDTNILCYLIDNTFPTLTAFIKALKEMPVVQLYSSEYVLAELFEVRKKEDFFAGFFFFLAVGAGVVLGRACLFFS